MVGETYPKKFGRELPMAQMLHYVSRLWGRSFPHEYGQKMYVRFAFRLGREPRLFLTNLVQYQFRAAVELKGSTPIQLNMQAPLHTFLQRVCSLQQALHIARSSVMNPSRSHTSTGTADLLQICTLVQLFDSFPMYLRQCCRKVVH